ncbi:hypothetical protein BT96DRAFT_984884 [Gymnopus androsaceus JB14]|uniref:Uncharacterized protein n=1 Tax=Gymnopus androsaceus JB14 TaxID=1447944 RepID=A0A6A4IIT4_9AGAR|nr:hypothetical protein BT96DRAFT_984884 [Gymnopus androsaceus JB14]
MGRTKINQGPISIAYGSDQITGYFICVKDTRLEYSPNVPPGVDKVVELVEQKQGYGGYFDLHTGLQGGFGFQVSLETILYYWEKYGVPKKDIEMARKGGDVGVMRNLRDLQNCDGNTQVPKKVPSLKSRYPTRLVKGYLFAKDASSPQPVTVEVEKLPAKNGEQAYEDPNYGVRKLLHLSPSSSFMCTAIYSSDSVRGGGDYMMRQSVDGRDSLASTGRTIRIDEVFCRVGAI